MSVAEGSHARILVIEDDAELLGLLREQLSLVGHRVEGVVTGGEGLFLAEEEPFDLIVLDLNLPDMDGIEIAERLQGGAGPPILMLTARGDVDSRVNGLYAGASDYVTKPFSVPELVARIHARLRERGEHGERPRYGDLELFPEASAVRVGADELQLPEREFELLRLFVENQGRVFSREDLEHRLYGDRMPGSNTVEVFVHNLRKKLAGLGVDGVIRTVRGKGYLLR